MINVTKSFLPPRSEFEHYVDQIWESGWLTNRGQLVNELEKKLKDYLGVRNILIVNNGTIALQIAIKALGLKGEIITTPFSYVATTSSIVWEGCTPVFADINTKTFNIDPDEVEKKITSKTSAILATHVFGSPCEHERLQSIVKKHNLKLIYDAAHTFGSRMGSISVPSLGDISTLSFHATKLFHTIEGGAIICDNDDLFHKLFYMHNFGHDGPERFHGLGINGKISEFNAAMGLAILPHVDRIIEKRKELYKLYAAKLNSYVQLQTISDEVQYNYAYMPVVFDSEQELLRVKAALNGADIVPRRYFYPSLNNLPYLPYAESPQSESLACRILCLPLYDELSREAVLQIVDVVVKGLGRRHQSILSDVQRF